MVPNSMIYVELLAIWRLKHSSVTCLTMHQVIRGKLICGLAESSCLHFLLAVHHFGIANKWSCCVTSWKENIVSCRLNGAIYQVDQLSYWITAILKKLIYVFVFSTEDPKDLIRKCLVVDPEKRINVRDALKHPFFNTVVSTILFSIFLS